MKFVLTLALSVFMSAGLAGAAVDPALLALMPADASALFGMQVRKVMASPFGNFALSQIPSNDGVVRLASLTGFDYRNDLDEMLGATVLPEGTKASIVVAKGHFQVTKFMALAASTGSTVTGYKNAQIVTLPDEDRTTLAFLDATTLATGTIAAVEAAADRYAAHAHFSGPLATRAMEASEASDVWFATVTPVANFFNSNAPPFAVAFYQNIVAASGGLQFGANGATLSSRLTTSTALQAQTLLTATQLIATAIGRLGRNYNSDAAQLAAIVSAGQFTVSGTSIVIAAPIAEKTLEQMYSARPGPTKKASLR
jgi:hypothetical protein